ncbi:MAG: type IV pilus secretin PilQ [Nitrospiraceae bacterium]|nr:type IV pilus secretin PilQ [Nitrospiraceae bacterium]
MKKITYPVLLISAVIMFAVFAGCAPRAAVKSDSQAAEEPVVITDMKIRDNSLEIVSNKPFVYTIYKGTDPYKMTIDIPDMGAGIFHEKIISDKAGISEVIPEQVDTPVKAMKITIALQSPSTVTPVYKDTTLTLMIKPEESVESAAVQNKAEEVPPAEVKKAEDSSPAAEGTPPPVAEKVNAPESAAPVESAIAYIPHATEITGIEVNKVLDAVKVVIQGNGSMMPNVFPIDERIVIDIPGVVMHTAVPSAVTSPLKGIRAGRHKDRVRLVLDLKEKTKFEVTAIGKSIEIALKGKPSAEDASENKARNRQPEPASMRTPQQEPSPEPAAPVNGKGPEAEQGKTAARYTGKKISLDFQDAEVGPIFRLLADVNGYNLVLDPAVKGKITIKLMNVPWDQALAIILNTFNLGKSVDGNILWIAPQSVFSKIAEEKSAAKVTEEKAEDLVQEIIRVNYASSADLAAAFTTGKLLSPRGTITQDTRMNTLIIKDTQKSIDKMKEMVKIMDVTKPQVMIEAKIVEVGNDYNETLGIAWGGALSVRSGANPISGNFSVNTPTVTAGPGTTNPGGTLGLTVGAANTLKVDLSLSALESIGKSKTLSNPKVLTLDGEAATIQQGRNFFISILTSNGPQTQQQTATLSLQVTPKITPDGYVQLKVNATDNSLESVNPPVVNTKSINTQALVKNGETLVLGGIFTTDVTEGETGVPLLSKVPGLGWLFKTKTQSGPNVKELLIFITPTIMSQPADNKL